MIKNSIEDLKESIKQDSLLFVFKNPLTLKKKDIDLSIQNEILSINKSNWVYTKYCCAGHTNKWEKGYSGPYLGLVTERQNKSDLFKAIEKSFINCKPTSFYIDETFSTEKWITIVWYWYLYYGEFSADHRSFVFYNTFPPINELRNYSKLFKQDLQTFAFHINKEL